MTERNMRPIPGDPATPQVVAFLDITEDTDWLLTTIGDYATCAAETWQRDESGWQRVVLLEWPTRRNHTDERSVVRLAIAPEDAEGLAEVLTHTARWLRAAAAIEGDT